MSEMENKTGTLTLIASNEEKEEWCKKELNGKKDSFYDSFVEAYRDRYIDDVVNTDYGLFRIDATDHDMSDYIADAVQINDKTYEVRLQWYNGGAGIDEVVEDALRKLKLKQE